MISKMQMSWLQKKGESNNIYLCSGLSIRYNQNAYETRSYYCLIDHSITDKLTYFVYHQ